MADPASEDLEVIVGEGGDGLPFSKGLLSRSLLATALDTPEALAVARAIERELRGRGAGTITREELRALAHRTLRERVGDEMAERYLLWRRYQEPERPVVLLLMGTSGVGKSSIALEVAHRLGIGRVQSTDSIREMMRIMLLPELVPAIHASSYDAYRRLPYEAGRPHSVIDGFRAQAVAVSVGVRAFIDRTVSEGLNLVIDGVSIVPDLLDLKAYEDRAVVVPVLIATLDEETLRGRFVARGAGRGRRGPHRYLEHLSGILDIQRHLLEQARSHGIPIVDNVSFDGSVRAVLGHLMQALRRASGA
ncbi:MAG: ATP cone domain-containing protein [Myxococcota bacterium]